jgi:hypothetical protein
VKAHLGVGGTWRSPQPLIAAIVACLFAVSCADSPRERTQPEAEPQGTATDCATLWTTVRESAVASGIEDGEARRLADQARVECEGVKGEVTGDQFADAPCGKDESARNAAPPGGNPKTIGIYLSCKADFTVIGTPEQPVYLAMREIPGSLTGSAAGQLEGAVRAYFAGPTAEEQSDGYFSAGPASMAEAIKNVSISGNSATIDFSADAGDRMGNLGTSTGTAVFIIELSATVFQFEGVDQLTLQVEGNCEGFWHLIERDCRVIKR